jgi:COMPASS component SWD3
LDGRYVLSCSDDGTLLLSRARDLAVVARCEGHQSYILTCDISPSGYRLASGGYDESIRIWEASSGKCLRLISAHAETVTSVTFSKNNMFILSSSWDGYCRIWCEHSGICIKSFELMGVPICFSTLSPNNQYVVASCIDSTIRLVQANEREWSGIFRGHINAQGYGLMAGFSQKGDADTELFTGSEDGFIIGFNINTQEEIWRVQISDGPTLCGDMNHEGTLLIAGASGEAIKTLQLWRRES